jgi:hypothetical protein
VILIPSPPACIPRLKRYLGVLREAIQTAQPIAGKDISVSEYPGKGTVINAKVSDAIIIPKTITFSGITLYSGVCFATLRSAFPDFFAIVSNKIIFDSGSGYAGLNITFELTDDGSHNLFSGGNAGFLSLFGLDGYRLPDCALEEGQSYPPNSFLSGGVATVTRSGDNWTIAFTNGDPPYPVSSGYYTAFRATISTSAIRLPITNEIVAPDAYYWVIGYGGAAQLGF